MAHCGPEADIPWLVFSYIMLTFLVMASSADAKSRAALILLSSRLRQTNGFLATFSELSAGVAFGAFSIPMRDATIRHRTTSVGEFLFCCW